MLTGDVVKIWFVEFCNKGDYTEIINKSKTDDLDSAIFDICKLYDLIEKEGTFSFATGYLCLEKEAPHKEQAEDASLEYAIRGPSDGGAVHYLQRIIEQLARNAKVDAEFKFQVKWKANEDWATTC